MDRPGDRRGAWRNDYNQTSMTIHQSSRVFQPIHTAARSLQANASTRDSGSRQTHRTPIGPRCSQERAQGANRNPGLAASADVVGALDSRRAHPHLLTMTRRLISSLLIVSLVNMITSGVVCASCGEHRSLGSEKRDASLEQTLAAPCHAGHQSHSPPPSPPATTHQPPASNALTLSPASMPDADRDQQEQGNRGVCPLCTTLVAQVERTSHPPLHPHWNALTVATVPSVAPSSLLRPPNRIA